MFGRTCIGESSPDSVKDWCKEGKIIVGMEDIWDIDGQRVSSQSYDQLEDILKTLHFYHKKTGMLMQNCG